MVRNMKELQSIMDKILTLINTDKEVDAFFRFIKDHFFEELPMACNVVNIEEVEKKMGDHFNIIMVVMLDYFMSTHCQSVKGILWNVLDKAIKKNLLPEKEIVFANAFRDSYLGLYKIEIKKGKLILEDLIDHGERLKIYSAPEFILNMPVPKEAALALRVVNFDNKLVVTQGFLPFPIKTATENLASLIQNMDKKTLLKDTFINKLNKLQQKLMKKKIWALEMMLCYAALSFGVQKNSKNITFH